MPCDLAPLHASTLDQYHTFLLVQLQKMVDFLSRDLAKMTAGAAEILSGRFDRRNNGWKRAKGKEGGFCGSRECLVRAVLGFPPLDLVADEERAIEK